MKPTRVRVLVVDDDSSLGRLLAKVLKGEGYQPIVCTNPKDALKVAEHEHTVFTLSLSKTHEVNIWTGPSAELYDISYKPVIRTEKRRYPRAEVNWPSNLRINKGNKEGEIRNISVGGCIYLLQEPARPGRSVWDDH